MKISIYGWKFILPSFFVGAGLLAAWQLKGPAWAAGLGGLSLAFCAFSLYFFRDPDRPLPEDGGKIYSPGDGRVLSVAKEGPADVTTVRIFLSVFDVHVQRLPCSGKVEKIQYVRGGFVNAMKKPESFANERSVVSIACPGKGLIVVEQIAGLIARRIRWWINEGAEVVAGKRYGLIQFGSQAAVHLPANAKPLVVPGQRAVGGVTPIAEWIAPS